MFALLEGRHRSGTARIGGVNVRGKLFRHFLPDEASPGGKGSPPGLGLTGTGA
jgi:hypothetical protein